MRVPAPKASVHGLRGACGSAPGEVSVRDVEEPQQRLQLTRRGVRRQRLIGGVGEQDQAVRAVRADEPVERGGDARVRVGRDARRDVEDDDAARRRGQQRPRLRGLPERARPGTRAMAAIATAAQTQAGAAGRALALPLERGTVAEWDRGRRHRYAPPPAACSTRSASVVASGGPGSGRDQATPAASAPAPARRRRARPGSPPAGGRRRRASPTRAGA